MTVRSQIPELDRGAFLLPPTYKIGGQNTPYKSGLGLIANDRPKLTLFDMKRRA